VSRHKQLTRGRVVHKSTGGISPSIPEPVDPVGNAAPLTSNTVAPLREIRSVEMRLCQRRERWRASIVGRPEAPTARARLVAKTVCGRVELRCQVAALGRCLCLGVGLGQRRDRASFGRAPDTRQRHRQRSSDGNEGGQQPACSTRGHRVWSIHNQVEQRQ
jgi:hypothetical protein